MLGAAQAALLGARFASGSAGAAGLTRPTPALVAGQNALPAGAAVYVATNGSDATGNGTLGNPYKTLEKAQNHAGLGAGWTIVLRGGTHARATTFAPTKSGANGNPITVMAYPGETVILDRNAEFAQFRTPGQAKWELYDAGLKVWRTKTIGEFSAGRLQGLWAEGDQHYQLWGYLSDGGWGSSSSYEGPMVRAQADGRIYLRFQKPLSSYTGTGWPAYVDGVSGGVFAIPASQDPNDYPIYLYRRGSASGSAATYDLNGRSYWEFKDINVIGSDVVAVLRGTTSGITFRRGLWLGCRYGTRILSGATTSTIAWLGMQLLHGAINYWQWHWIKNGGASGDQDDSGAWNYNGTSSNHTIEDCVVWNFFDLIIGNNPAANLLFRYNWLDNIRDDCTQQSQLSNGIEWAYNFFYNSPMWSWNFTSTGSSTGNVYIHHNVCWQLWPAFWNPGDRPGCNKLLVSHGSSEGQQPQKIYNNTLIVNSSAAAASSVSLGHCDCRRANVLAIAHEVYNNLIMVLADELWHNGEGGAAEHDLGSVRASLDGTSNERYDCNHFAKILAYAPARSPLIGPYYGHPDKTGGPYSYSSAAALAGASENTINAEAGGTDETVTNADITTASPLVDPFDFDFRPKPGSALESGARDLSSTGWPGASSAPWRGALDSSGSGEKIGPRG